MPTPIPRSRMRRCYDNRMNSAIALTSARMTAGVCPGVGGALVWFGLRDSAIDFVRPTPMRAMAENNARMASSYPLVPYSNRIGDGRFAFDGATIALRRNADISEHPIHGLGFIRAWTVVDSTPSRLEIAFEHDGANGTDGTDPDWPWSFRATQVFAIDDAGLSVRIEVTNRDRRPMPAGIGLHPFFPKTPSTEVRFAADAVWLSDKRMLPASRIDVPPRFDFAQRRAVADLDVDN